MATQRQLQYRAQQQLRGNTPQASDVWRWQGFIAPGVGRITNASGVEIIAPVQGNASTAIGAQVLYIPGQPTGVIRLKEVVVPGVPLVNPTSGTFFSFLLQDQATKTMYVAKGVNIDRFDPGQALPFSRLQNIGVYDVFTENKNLLVLSNPGAFAYSTVLTTFQKSKAFLFGCAARIDVPIEVPPRNQIIAFANGVYPSLVSATSSFNVQDIATSLGATGQPLFSTHEGGWGQMLFYGTAPDSTEVVLDTRYSVDATGIVAISSNIRQTPIADQQGFILPELDIPDGELIFQPQRNRQIVARSDGRQCIYKLRDNTYRYQKNDSNTLIDVDTDDWEAITDSFDYSWHGRYIYSVTGNFNGNFESYSTTTGLGGSTSVRIYEVQEDSMVFVTTISFDLPTPPEGFVYLRRKFELSDRFNPSL